jgi:2-polyprenyl-3-methyl-5-hydroxy-6-metoxy-1,4-benzoquinol methylase
VFSQSDCVPLRRCLACGSNELRLVLDLGDQPLANSYKKTQSEKQEHHPLAVNLCGHCFHLQLTHAVNPDRMYREYLYVSGTSRTMDDHFRWFSEYVDEYLNLINKTGRRKVLDIGCNDGSQLKHFAKLGYETYGVDPAKNLHHISSQDHTIYDDYFGTSLLQYMQSGYDAIVAQNVFAHNHDPVDFLRAAGSVLAHDGLIFIQTSQCDMISNGEFDTIYHEHISFYNINSMDHVVARAGLQLTDVIKCPLHGNSYIFVISRNHGRPALIRDLIAMETKAGLYSVSTYDSYRQKCESLLEDLRSHALEATQRRGFQLIGYGAAAKGMTLINAARLELDMIIDDNPLKQGTYAPGVGTPIVAPDALDQLGDRPVMFVPLAWNFFDEIRVRINSCRDDPRDRFLSYFPSIRETT